MKRKILIPVFVLLVLAAFFLGQHDVLRLRETTETQTPQEAENEDLLVGILLLPEWPDWTVYDAGMPSQDDEARDALFSELNGIPYFWGVCEANEKIGDFIWSVAGEGISDPEFGSVIRDTADSEAELPLGNSPDVPNSETQTITRALDGTLYVRNDVDDGWTLHGIPIYQKPTGEIYAAKAGHDNRFFAHGMTITLRDARKTTGEEGEEILISKVKLSCKTINHPGNCIRLLQMDENHEILAEQSYDVTAMPEDFTPMLEASYLLVEADETDSMGRPGVHRTLCQSGDKSFSYFVAADNGVCVKKSCYLHYGE
ncbi:MAG: hypothetical protein IIY70_04470 [Oscillospiraceae bacterium]|nr:hypothetical protein [Oscillospiraceae bacterium]